MIDYIPYIIMLEYEEEIEEIAPDLSTIKKNKKILSKVETDSVFSDNIVKKPSRISAKRSATKSAKKVVPKKTLPGTKLDKVVESLKTVDTENAVNTKDDKIIDYYKNMTLASTPKDIDDVDGNEIGNEINNEINNKVKSNKKTGTIKENYNDEEKEKLRGIITLFLTTDEKLSKISVEAKDIRDEKKQYEEYILEYMSEKHREKVTHDDGTLYRNVKETRPKPKEENILKTLEEVFKDPEVAYEITKKIFDSVPMEEKVTLKKEKEADDKAKKQGKK